MMEEDTTNANEFDTVEIVPPQDNFVEEIENEKNDKLDDIPTSTNGEADAMSIVVGPPQKIGDGMGSYVAYKVTTTSNIPSFKKQVSRRFSDFLGLHEKLSSKHLRNGRIIPPPPEKHIFGTTKVKMSGKEKDEMAQNHDFLENRRAALERYLNRTAQHPVLREDPDFVTFLENDEELPRAVSTSTLSGAGVMRLFNKVGETVNKITYRMDESDPWFNEKVAEIEVLDTQLQKLYATSKSLFINRKELSMLTAGVAKSAAIISGLEEHTGLSRALSQLADVEEKIELLRSEQGNSDLYILAEHFKDYLGLINAIKDILHERVKVFQNWEYAKGQLTKKRENKAKLELAGRNEKIDFAEKEVDDWQIKVDRLEKDFSDISAQVKQEIIRFDLQRVRDFKAVIVKYLEDQMAHQNQLMKYWQSYLEVANEIS